MTCAPIIATIFLSSAGIPVVKDFDVPKAACEQTLVWKLDPALIKMRAQFQEDDQLPSSFEWVDLRSSAGRKFGKHHLCKPHVRDQLCISDVHMDDDSHGDFEYMLHIFIKKKFTPVLSAGDRAALLPPTKNPIIHNR